MNDLALFRRRVQAELRDATTLVVLFGSQARGTPGPHSDVDLLVVSSAFQGHSQVSRAARVRRAWGLAYPVDFLCYTPAEFERLRRQVSIVSEALREGVAIEG